MEEPRRSSIILSSLADTTRSRILLLLDRRELTVSEICARDAAAAVHGQPASEGAGRQRLGGLARRRHEQRLHDDARPRHVAAPAVAAGARAGRNLRPLRLRINGAFRPRSRTVGPSRRSFSRRRQDSGIGCATTCLAIASTSRRSRHSPTAIGSSAISAAAPDR